LSITSYFRKRRLLAGGLVAALALSLAGTAGATTSRHQDDSLTGAGSTFVSPLVTAWLAVWAKSVGVNATYAPIGSGGGIASITNRTVDYGATDAPLTPDQLTACKGCVQIPVALSANSVFYNVKGAPNNLKITGPLIADIYMGKITKWSDPKIKSLNPGVNLPDEQITPVYRSDGSGTSYNFTDYLSKISKEFASSVGKSTQPPFKVGVGARGSSGVSGAVASTEGAVGYADVAFALKNHLHFFAVQNAAGKFTLPGIKQTLAAAATVKSIPADNAISIVNPPKSASDAYPICTFVWFIVPTNSPKADLIKKFIKFGISPQGQKLGLPLIFSPMPKVVAVASVKTLAKVGAGAGAA
jgi:phosphate transport system substrate-binding protein